MRSYSIRAVRLVCFHNFEDETIPITGDLFILGENTSGKTTILDALQLALSGGQDFDWNAAAGTDGGRQRGRSLSGVILRADLSGQPRRKGPAITYVVVELASDNDTVKSLVYGASVTEMTDAPTVWGAVVDRPLVDVPVTRPNEDGSALVLDADELEAELGQRVWRSVGHYRSRVAEFLCDNREEYGRITRLWQKAKSFRELARAARQMNELFLGVLPPPDPEPFHKVRKAFADIQKCRADFQDIRQQIELLIALNGSLDNVRESREAHRRYEYLAAKTGLEARRADLEEARRQLGRAEDEHSTLSKELDEQERRKSGIEEELSLIRRSDGFQTAELIEQQELRLREEQEQRGQLKEEARRAETTLADSRTNLKDARRAAEQTLISARAAGEEWHRDASPACRNELLPVITTLLSVLPADVDAELDIDALGAAVGRAERAATEVGRRLAEQKQEEQSRLRDCSRRRHEREEKRKQLLEAPDLFPERRDVLEALAELRRRGVAARLLYQDVEFRDNVPEALQRVVEEVLQEATLFTLVVDPAAVGDARAAILPMNSGVRVLDASPAAGAPPPVDPNGLSTLLAIEDDRVRAHIATAFASASLVSAAPAEGDPRAWFDQAGCIGDAAARWQLPADSPRWIGREQRTMRKRQLLDQLAEESVREEGLERELEAAVKSLGEAETFAGELRYNIPKCVNLEVLKSQWSGARAAAQREQHDAQRAAVARAAVDASRDRVKAYESQLRTLKEREGADAAKIRRQYRRLEQRRGRVSGIIGRLQNDRGAAKERRAQAETAVEAAAPRVGEAEASLERSVAALLALPGLPDAAELDDYVIHRKRGHLVKDPAQKIQEALTQEAGHLARLSGGDGVLHPHLAMRFGLSVNDTGDSIEVADRQGQALGSLLRERQDTERDLERTIDEQTRTLYEQVLANELVDRLRGYRRELDSTIHGINTVLSGLRFGGGVFRVHAKPLAEARPLLELLRAQSLLDESHRQQLFEFLEARQAEFEDEKDVPQFLDYRHWFDFSLEYRQVSGEDAAVMGPEAMIRGSGGEQSTHLYLLLFALASLLFDRARSKLRFIMMDEALPNVDPTRKELLLTCAKQLGLDLAIATPDLDGTILGPKRSHTTILVERDGESRVAITPLAFTATPDQGRLFEAARAKPYIGVEALTE
jgi:hypothetical protein